MIKEIANLEKGKGGITRHSRNADFFYEWSLFLSKLELEHAKWNFRKIAA